MSQSAATAESAIRTCAPQASASDPCNSRTAANTLCIFSLPTRLFSNAARANEASAKKPLHAPAPNAASETRQNAAAAAAAADQDGPSAGEDERERDDQRQSAA